MRIGKTREQQQRLRQRTAELARIGLTHKQIAERLGVADSSVPQPLVEGKRAIRLPSWPSGVRVNRLEAYRLRAFASLCAASIMARASRKSMNQPEY
jgi:hypothetical protein